MLQSTVLRVDFATNARKRDGSAAQPVFEGVMPFNSEDEALCRLLAQAQARSIEPSEPPAGPRADTARGRRGKPAATLAVALLAGLFAGALWKV